MKFSSFNTADLEANMNTFSVLLNSDNDVANEIRSIKYDVCSYIIEAQNGLDSSFANSMIKEKMTSLKRLGCSGAVSKFMKHKRWT